MKGVSSPWKTDATFFPLESFSIVNRVHCRYLPWYSNSNNTVYDGRWMVSLNPLLSSNAPLKSGTRRKVSQRRSEVCKGIIPQRGSTEEETIVSSAQLVGH
jgi:hypothetical protein